MKVIILAAGQGTRLRPLTDDRPKCMVEIKGKSIIERQLETLRSCGIRDGDVAIVTGCYGGLLKERLKGGGIRFIDNDEYNDTNMVYSLMCAKVLLETEEDIIVSYGDIIYNEAVFRKLLEAENDISVIVDDGWQEYWRERCENPLDDAETLMLDGGGFLTEIGQKTDDIGRVQAQYIGLMRFKGAGLKALLTTAEEAEARSRKGIPLWRAKRAYRKMYMTDLLQGMIDEGHKLKAVHIRRGWFEVDDTEDLRIAEAGLE